MPVSPVLAENLTRATVDAYLDAERSLLERIARAIARGIDAPGWAEQQLLRIQRYRVEAEQVLADLTRTGSQTVAEAVLTGWNRGSAAGALDLTGALGMALSDAVEPLPGRQAAAALVTEAVATVQATHPRILRSTMDAYRAVVAEVSTRTLVGAETRRETAQDALDRFAARGITGFIDRAGRGWDLASYTEMAVRTATAHAAVDAHTDRLTAGGLDLVVVSDAPQECVTCRPWEGKVLSLTGGIAGVIDRPHATVDGRTVRVRVAGTLAQARAAGLYHPGCRHSHSAYLPGVTQPPTATGDPQGDADRRRLRALERRVRAAKRLEATALDETARRTATARVRAGQAAIREHVASSTAKRQPAREQIGSAR